MEKKIQAFVSSTFTDLKEERKIVLDMLLQNSFIPAGMENFPASQLQQLDFIKPVIDASDIYILVIGARYGSLSPSGLSYTEEEYNYAESQNKVILAFIHSNPDSIPYGKSEVEAEKRELLNKFRARVLGLKTCKLWESPYELSSSISASIHQAKSDPRILGWVRGNSALTMEGQLLLRQAQMKEHDLISQIERASDKYQKLEPTVLAQFNDATKAATPAEFDAWEAGAIIQGQPQKLINHTPHLGEIRIAHKDFVLPTLFGARAVVIIIPQNIKVYKTDMGHSTLLYMSEFRVEGNIAEMYSERQVE